MVKRKAYVESLRSELKNIRRKLHDSNHGEAIYSIDRKDQPSSMLKHYEGMEYIVREAVKNLEMGRDADEIEHTLHINEARFRKIIQSKTGQPSSWRYYAKGGLEGVLIVRALIA